MQAETRVVEATKDLTDGYSQEYGEFMARFLKLAASLSKQIGEDARSLSALNEEMDGLRDFAARFRELEDVARTKEERLEIALALMMNRKERDDVKASAEFGQQSEPDLADVESIPVSADRLKLSLYPLWKILREILRQTGQIQVFKLERMLKDFRMKRTRRQSIESALRTHPREFQTVKRGREKYVFLK